jgi:ubiquinone/menaquinone biosynthesis C-methylase UbiE
MNDSFSTIAEAFSRTGEKYDAFALDHPNLARMRGKVYAHLERFLPDSARILELNAGTGIDAVALARRGYSVHATDIAPGMLERARVKAVRLGLRDQITIQECSFTRLGEIEGAPYDAVFSNLGGLNCIPDLAPVIQQLPEVLKPGGLVTFVLMPPICLWELAELLRGHLNVAFRRLARSGTRTHLEGLYFTIHYFTPRQVVSWFGPDYDVIDLEGLSVFTPTAESKNVPSRYPRLYKLLVWLDDWLSHRPPWRGWGDFYILSMRLRP